MSDELAELDAAVAKLMGWHEPDAGCRRWHRHEAHDVLVYAPGGKTIPPRYASALPAGKLAGRWLLEMLLWLAERGPSSLLHRWNVLPWFRWAISHKDHMDWSEGSSPNVATARAVVAVAEREEARDEET